MIGMRRSLPNAFGVMRGPGGFWEKNDQRKFTFQNYVADPEHRKERWRQMATRKCGSIDYHL